MQSIHPQQPQIELHAPPPKTHSTFKWVVRLTVAGCLFAIPIASVSPLSPMMKLSLQGENQQKAVNRIMMDFFGVNFVVAAASYGFFIDRRTTNPKAKDGFLPYLGPLTAQVPAISCCAGSHLYYPGLWAFAHEVTAAAKWRECVRLTLKTMLAYSPAHFPAALVLGTAVGVLMFPFKYWKRPSDKGTESRPKALTL